MACSLSEVRAWVPEAAVRDGRLATYVSEIVETWVRDWIAEPPRPSLSADLGLALRRPGENDVCWRADGLVLAVSRHGLVAMGAVMAGYKSPAARSEDEAMLAKLAEAGLAEFWAACAMFFCIGGTPSRTTNASLDDAARIICRFGDCGFELFITRDRLAAARRALAAPVKRLPPLENRAAALARQTLDVAVLVGGARLGLHDVRTLNIGDIIVLDRNTQDALELVVAGKHATGMNCRFDRDGERIGIRITSSA